MKDIQKLIEVVKSQFEDPEIIDLDSETDFKALESFDSLTGMCIIVAIKDEFGIEISAENFRSIRTINELKDLIK